MELSVIGNHLLLVSVTSGQPLSFLFVLHSILGDFGSSEVIAWMLTWKNLLRFHILKMETFMKQGFPSYH